ncbi:hypothetical protein G6553_14820 [Nocardioides sp. IC4_145]|uniref:hypothetical protein n=1 Tax=Nocardioides sp. IC4_145 TaxID=2714037 RepID=UPI00140C1140|nr:hypothetical protein [Nocardioides sp. IC4_145]NHC24441.1 hypothetical protein [Nocardioides sp. IC4_145]
MTATTDASYAVEVARLLWPAPRPTPYLTRTRDVRGAGSRDVLVLPSGRRPRMLVPADVPGSAPMVRRLGGGSTLARPARRVLEGSVRAGVLPLLRWPVVRVPAAGGIDSVEDHLSRCLQQPVRVGVLLGTRRVNQKPVLQVYRADGRLCAYAKVGHNPLTAGLVRREAAALAALAGCRPRTFRVPELLHHGTWAGLEVLVLSPLTVGHGPVPARVRDAAAHELAGLAGTSAPRLAAGPFWQRLSASAAVLPAQPGGDRVAAALEAVAASDGAEPVRLGGWHGDWGAWNMGLGDGVLNVWDWERYDPAVPLGFDGLHFAAQAVRPGQRDAARQERTFLEAVPTVLATADVPTRHHALTLRLYLLEVAVRYLDALTHGDTPALRRRTSWVLSLLERLAEPSSHSLLEGRR